MPPQHGKCLKKGTKIQLADGRIVPIENICRSDMVISIDRANNLTMSRVNAVSENGEKPLLKLTLKSGREISCSINHKFLTVSGWVEASVLHEGDYIAASRRTPIPDGEPLPYGFASLLGYLVGDGSFGKGSPIITSANEAIVEHLKQIADYHNWKLYKADTNTYHIRNKIRTGSHDGSSCQEKLRAYTQPATSAEKRVPECIFKAGRQDLVDFLGAYFNCDGTVTAFRDGVAEYYSINHDLLSDVQSLLSRLGIYSKIQPKKGRYNGRQHLSWRLVINGQDLVTFADSVPVIGSKGIKLQEVADKVRGRRHFPEYEAIPNGWQQYLKMGKGWHRSHTKVRVDKKYSQGTARLIVQKIAEAENNEELRKLCNPDIIWERVVRIDPGGTAETYDLETEAHNFIAEGLVTHNSELVSRWFPIWLLDLFPWLSIILCSYEAEYAAKWGRRVRDGILANPDYLRARISDTSGAANQWETTQGGGMTTAGAGGPITGNPAHVLIIDDPTKNREQAESPAYKERTWEWWQGTARPRINPLPWAPYGVCIVMATRWAVDDLPGRLVAHKVSEDSGALLPWYEYKLPAIAGENDPLGRAEGEALWPEKYPIVLLDSIRADVGPYNWMSEYQQSPILKQGSLFQRSYFQPIRILR